MSKATARFAYSPEERKARLDEAHAEMVAAVEAIATGDDWRAFLDFARKLHAYSAGNRMWLWQQAMLRGWDELGHVAGFRTWISLGRYVRKGEHGLKVLAPCVRKVTDDETGDETRRVVGWTIDTVFAACQTDGDGDIPEPIRPELLTGDAEGWDALVSLVEARGFTVTRGALFPANGTTSFATRSVLVADRLDGAAALKTLAHEMAHVMLHEHADYHQNRGRCEVEAESVAYLVCGALGISSDAYTFPYVTTWASGDLKVVTAAADVAIKCAGEIIDALEASRELVAA